jgi:hypothetical protein
MNDQGCTECVIIIRPSFKKFCEQDPCRAALFNHLLYWIAKKAKGQTEEKIKSGDVYWFGSAEEICAGLDHSWSVNKVRKEINALVGTGLVGQRHNPTRGFDQTRHYFIGVEQGGKIREACEKYDVCLNHLGLRPDVIHLLNLVNASNKNGKCKCQICEMDLPKTENASTKSGIAIPKVSTKGLPPKDTEEGRENNIEGMSPLSELSSSHTHLQSDDSSVSSQAAQGGSLSPNPGGDTLNLANAQPLLASGEKGCASNLPIVQQSGMETLNERGDIASAQGYMKDGDRGDANHDGDIPAGNVAVVEMSQQSVSTNSTGEVAQPSLIDAPLMEPDMSGPWAAEKVVQYAEFHNGKRYAERVRKGQIEAARAIHRDDGTLTLEQFKQAYDERNDEWWRKEQGNLHTTHMRSKERSSGIIRLYAMLDRIEARKRKKIIPIRPDVASEDAVQRARANNQKALEKMQRLIAEKQERKRINAAAK